VNHKLFIGLITASIIGVGCVALWANKTKPKDEAVAPREMWIALEYYGREDYEHPEPYPDRYFASREACMEQGRFFLKAFRGARRFRCLGPSDTSRSDPGLEETNFPDKGERR
jgi:hypothetical protein